MLQMKLSSWECVSAFIRERCRFMLYASWQAPAAPYHQTTAAVLLVMTALPWEFRNARAYPRRRWHGQVEGNSIGRNWPAHQTHVKLCLQSNQVKCASDRILDQAGQQHARRQ